MLSPVDYIVSLFNLIAPKQCAMCGCRLAVSEDVICTSCNIDLPRTGFSEHPYDNEMAKLFWGRIPVERAAALFYYRAHSVSSRIIYQMKYYDHPEIGELMGRMAATEFMAAGFFEGVDVVVPVPLARKRQRERGYNQSFEIARGVNDITHLPVESKAVKRKSFKESQTKMNRWQRNDNVKDVFTLNRAERLAGKHVLVVDDVVTTGATVISCAEELMKCGDVKFSVMSLGFTKQI